MTKLVQQWNAWRQADNHKTKIDLCGANLCEADLCEANLCEANWLFQITGEKWQIIITKNQIQIGCKVYPAQYWMEFNDITIRKMDTSFNCVEWWHENKEFVRMCYNKCAGRWHWDRI